GTIHHGYELPERERSCARPGADRERPVSLLFVLIDDSIGDSATDGTGSYPDHIHGRGLQDYTRDLDFARSEVRQVLAAHEPGMQGAKVRPLGGPERTNQVLRVDNTGGELLDHRRAAQLAFDAAAVMLDEGFGAPIGARTKVKIEGGWIGHERQLKNAGMMRG